LFKTEAKLDLVHVPCRRVGPAVTDMPPAAVTA